MDASSWAAIERIAGGLGVGSEALRKWRVRGVPRAWRLDLLRADIHRELVEADFDRPPGPRRQHCRTAAATLCLIVGLGVSAHADRYDPHLLLLAWPDRQETVPATTPEACEAAVEAIAHHRWLTDDPPAEARCVKGDGFAAGWDCIQGFNCEGSR